MAEAVVRSWSVKKGVLIILQNSQENTLTLIKSCKLEACHLIKKEIPSQVLSYKI